MIHNGKGYSSLVLVFCINLEWHIYAVMPYFTSPFYKMYVKQIIIHGMTGVMDPVTEVH